MRKRVTSEPNYEECKGYKVGKAVQKESMGDL